MTTTEQARCAVCGNGMERLPWGATVHPEKRAAIELDGLRFPVHRECIRVHPPGAGQPAGPLRGAMREVRDLPGGRSVWERVDAHPGIRLDRDMGAGQGPDGWLAEVADFLERAADPDHCDGFTGEDAWGPCARCGRTLADHDD
jgi:hypothetical protein